MTTAEILDNFSRLSALVVGDICLDRWCAYDPAAAEPSRETGIDRIAVVSVENTPGAGGTVANNLAAMRAGRVAVLGAIGADGHGFELRKALASRGIAHDLLIESAGIQTFTYTKLLNRVTGAEDLPRVDYIATRPAPADIEGAIADRLHAAAPDFDVIIVSDQAETSQGGFVTAKVREALAALARIYPSKVIWVDSRMRAELFRDVLVKPNEREANEASMRAFGKLDLPALRRLIGSRPLIVTKGASGAEVYDDEGARAVRAVAVDNPVDICGAGDSFSAAAALSYAVTRSAYESARVGNLAAAVTIMKKGTGAASREEMLA